MRARSAVGCPYHDETMRTEDKGPDQVDREEKAGVIKIPKPE